jgi:ATPase family associated with various cellular activities (AAA)
MQDESNWVRRFSEHCRDTALSIETLVISDETRPLDLVMPDLTAAPFGTVCTTFGLSEFECWVLLLAAAQQLHSSAMLRACAVDLNMFSSEQWLGAFLCPYVLQQWLTAFDPDAFLPGSALLSSGLIVLKPSGYGSNNPMLDSLQITPGALAFLQGSRGLSPEAAQFLTPLHSGAWLGQSQQAALEEMTSVISEDASPPPIVNLYSTTPEAALEVAQMYGYGQQHTGHQQGGQVAGCWLLDLSQIERSVQQEQAGPETVLGLLHRDLTYLGGTLVVQLEDEPDVPTQNASRLSTLGWSPRQLVQALCSRLTTSAILISRDPVVFDLARDVYAIAALRPTPEEQMGFWGQALGFSGLYLSTPQVTAGLQHLTTQFSLGSQKIQQVARDANRHAAQKYSQKGGQQLSFEQLMQEVWDACKRQGRRVFQGIAEHIGAGADWDSLILPTDDLTTLRDIVTQVQHRHEVYRAWGYGAQERGLGITVLFSGTSGGGKTYAAEVLASALNLDLYRIDLSSVTSKWIGETEKNLKKVFDAADEGGAILLFDEADSVFGKRGDAQSSNDRYANLTTNYLLQRMEAYRGLAILTTNYEGNIDAAFMRRIRFTVRFREPDEALRVQLWQRAFPAGVAVQGLDHRALAKAKLTGANIKAIAMNASFLASARRVPITTALIEESIVRELKRQGRLVLGPAN